MRRDRCIWLCDRCVYSTTAGELPPSGTSAPLSGSSRALPVDELSRAVLAAVRDGGPRHPSCTLVLSSAWCYVHPFEILVRRPSRQALEYAFEAFLPVDVERLDCAFVPRAPGAYIGVAVALERFRALLQALESTGLEVCRVSVDVLEAARVRFGAGSLVWVDNEHLATLTQDKRQVTDLRVVRLCGERDDEEWVRQALDTVTGRPLDLRGCATDRVAQLRLRCEVADESAESDRGIASDFDLKGNHEGHGSQLRTWRVVRRATIAVLAAVLLLSLGNVVQRAQATKTSRDIADWEGSLFVRVFPGQPVPGGIALRLASERKHAEGLTLARTPTDLRAFDALRTLAGLIGSLPLETRINIQEIRVDAGGFVLRGELRDHRDAETVALAVEKLDRVTCDAPRTNRLEDGRVQFHLQGHSERLKSDVEGSK